MNNIHNQLCFYKQNSKKISDDYKGKVIIIAPDMSIRDYITLEEAYSSGVKEYGYGNFLLKDFSNESLNTVNMVNPSITTIV